MIWKKRIINVVSNVWNYEQIRKNSLRVACDPANSPHFYCLCDTMSREDTVFILLYHYKAIKKLTCQHFPDFVCTKSMLAERKPKELLPHRWTGNDPVPVWEKKSHVGIFLALWRQRDEMTPNLPILMPKIRPNHQNDVISTSAAYISSSSAVIPGGIDVTESQKIPDWRHTDVRMRKWSIFMRKKLIRFSQRCRRTAFGSTFFAHRAAAGQTRPNDYRK